MPVDYTKFRSFLSHRTLASCLTICVLLALATASKAIADDPPTAGDERKTEAIVSNLIKALNSDRFNVRESAARELEKIGAPAFRALAVNVLGNSPETAWRTRQTIERIGTQGDESVFFQALGVLQTLQLDDGRTFDGRFAILERNWKIERKKSLIKSLRKLGAQVSDPWENSLGPQEQNLTGIANAIVLDAPFGERNTRSAKSVETAKKIKTRTKTRPTTALDYDSTTEKIDEILSNSLEENRELVFGKRELESDPVIPTSNVIDSVEVFRLQRNQAFLRRPNLRSTQTANGVTVALTDKWQGTLEELGKIRFLPGLSKVELVAFMPGRQQLKALANLNAISEIAITGEQIPDEDLSILAKAPSLSTVQFKNRKITADALNGFADAGKLSVLKFEKCVLNTQALQQLKQSKILRSVYFSEMQIDNSVFDSLIGIRQLNYVDLSVCKFKTTAYKSFLVKRPNVQIAFTPQAFLGVRGPVNFADNATCQISEVIPDSGADAGGIKIGDIIESVNGQRIRNFDDLRLHIAQHKVGEKLLVEVQREGDSLDLEITLGRYSETLR